MDVICAMDWETILPCASQEAAIIAGRQVRFMIDSEWVVYGGVVHMVHEVCYKL